MSIFNGKYELYVEYSWKRDLQSDDTFERSIQDDGYIFGEVLPSLHPWKQGTEIHSMERQKSTDAVIFNFAALTKIRCISSSVQKHL